MGLGIYTAADVNSAISLGDRSSPLQIALNGKNGDSKEIQLFVRSDSDILTYTSITVRPVLLTGDKNLISGTDFYWKLKVGSLQPTSSEWSVITAGNTIAIPDLSDSGTFAAFWLKVVIPVNATTSSFTHISLRIEATET